MGYVNTQMVPEETTSLMSYPLEIVKEICSGIELGYDRIYPDQLTKDFIDKNPINTIFFK